MDAVTHPPAPVNEAVLTYRAGSPEAAALHSELASWSSNARPVGPVIAGEAQDVAAGPAEEAEKWGRKTAEERRSTMKDGYLGFNIAQYEAWAVLTAQESPDAPTPKEVKAIQQKAQSHCADTGITLSMPPFSG